jgi:hypothetical protein
VVRNTPTRWQLLLYSCASLALTLFTQFKKINKEKRHIGEKVIEVVFIVLACIKQLFLSVKVKLKMLVLLFLAGHSK